MEEQVRRIMADILAVDLATISETSTMDGIESWDSLAHINLVSALEEEFGVTLDVEEIESMLSFADILYTLEQKL